MSSVADVLHTVSTSSNLSILVPNIWKEILIIQCFPDVSRCINSAFTSVR